MTCDLVDDAHWRWADTEDSLTARSYLSPACIAYNLCNKTQTYSFSLQ